MVVEQEDDVESRVIVERTLPSFRGRRSRGREGESSPSVIHRDLITARTETRAHLDVAFSPSRLS